MIARGLGLAFLIACAAIAVASSCSVESRSTTFRCDNGTCPNGRTCSQGWCVADTTPDARPDGRPRPDGSNCPQACDSCMGGTCLIRCNTGGACGGKITCPAGMPCSIDCSSPGSCGGGIDCSAATSCTVSCGGNNSCAGATTCGTGACDVTCGGSSSCGGAIDCAQSCKCDTSCTGTGACGATTSCPAPGVCKSGKTCTSTPAACHSC